MNEKQAVVAIHADLLIVFQNTFCKVPASISLHMFIF